MNNQGFLKEAGGFLLAFVLGSVGMHGILYYLITDAGDLLGGVVFFLPIVLFLIGYGIFPLLILFLWRYRYSHTQVIKHIDKSSTFYPKYAKVEKVAFIILGIGLLSYIVFLITAFYFNYVINPLLWTAIGLTTVVIIGLVWLFVLLKIEKKSPTGALKLYKPVKTNPNHYKFKNAYIEFCSLIILWVIAFVIIICVMGHNAFINKIVIDADVSIRLKDYHDKIKKTDSLIKLQKEVSNQFLMKPIVSTNKKDSLEKIANNIKPFEQKLYAEYTQNTDNISPVINSLINEINNTDFTKQQQQLTSTWLSSIDTKLSIVKKNDEDKVAAYLYNILVNVQYYYVALIFVLLFYAIINWFVLSHINRLIQFKNKSKEPPAPLPEIEFAKFYIMLLLVMLAPILKPLERKDIQYNKPLWTFGQASVYNITNNNVPKDNSGELPNLTINTFNWGIDTLGLYNNRKAFYDSIKSIMEDASYDDTYIQCLLNELQFATDSSRRAIIKAIANIDTGDGGALAQRVDSIIKVVTFKNVFKDTTRNLRNSIAANTTSIDSNSTSIGANKLLIDENNSSIKNNKTAIRRDSILIKKNKDSINKVIEKAKNYGSSN